jgi:S1-C subfamily serine protease
MSGAARTTSIVASSAASLILIAISACTNPRQFGRASTAPAPSAIGGGPVLASRAPAALRMIRPAPLSASPIYADEIQAGAPWSGLRLAMQSSAQGIFVGLVSNDSPAEAAGIQAGDFIFQLDGHAVSDAREVMSEVDRVGVGGSVRLGVHRNNHVRLFRVEPVAKPAPAGAEAAEHAATSAILPSAALEPPSVPGKSD